MQDWNPEKYLQFQRQRTQPAIDLAARIKDRRPRTAVDIGCGPGNSTAVLKEFFPETEILGIDSSESMIQKAHQSHPELTFACLSAEELTGQHDLLFSNACLQWIPHHETLLPRLIDCLTPDGILAVQIPMNQEEPLLRIIRETAADSRWDFSHVNFEHNEVLTPQEYFSILSHCTVSFDLWETVYYHPMPSHQHLIEWVRGTRLRPYLEVLNRSDAVLFEREILRRSEEAYAKTPSGEVVLKFRRFFFIAQR